MVRSCVSWVRRLLYALVVLALVGCLLEIALRVYDSATGQVTRRDLYDHGLTCKSWFTHHTLKPSRGFSVRNPDTDERARVITNSWGLRGPEPAIPKPAGLLRIVCLGDEGTLAPQLADEETFCAHLARELTGQAAANVEVLNAGVPDYCPLLELLQVRHQLLGLAPDVVIVNFDMSDVADDYAIRRHVVMAADGSPLSCAHPTLEFSRKGNARPGGDSPLLAPIWCRHKLMCLLSHQNVLESGRGIESARSRYVWLEDQPPDWSVHIQQALAPLAQLRELLAPLGTMLVVTACPAPWQVSEQASQGQGVREQAGVSRDAVYRSRQPFEMLAEFCRLQGIEFCDVSPAFQRAPQGERLYLTNAAAYSAEGHALHGRELAQFLGPRLTGPGQRPPGSAPVRAVPPLAATAK